MQIILNIFTSRDRKEEDRYDFRKLLQSSTANSEIIIKRRIRWNQRDLRDPG